MGWGYSGQAGVCGRPIIRIVYVAETVFRNAAAFQTVLRDAAQLDMVGAGEKDLHSALGTSDLVWVDGLGERFWRLAEGPDSRHQAVVRLSREDLSDVDALLDVPGITDVIFPGDDEENLWCSWLKEDPPFRIHTVVDRDVAVSNAGSDVSVRLLVEIACTPAGTPPMSLMQAFYEMAPLVNGRCAVIGSNQREASRFAAHLRDAWGLDADYRHVTRGLDAEMGPLDTVVFWNCLLGRPDRQQLVQDASGLLTGERRLLALEQTTVYAAATQEKALVALPALLAARFPGLRARTMPFRWVLATSPSAQPPAKRTFAPGAAEGPLVSVLIPTYNDAPRLGRCIRSIVDGRYRNVEIVVIDDGSTDNTAQVVAGFGDAGVRYFHKEHSGRPESRNMALEKSTGDLVAWLDSDDWALPGRLCAQVDRFIYDPTLDIVHTDILMIDDAAGLKQVRCYTDFAPEELPGLLMTGFSTVCPVVNSSTMLRRRCYDLVGQYDPTFQRAQDYDFWVRCAARPEIRFGHIGEILTVVQLRERTTTELALSIFTHYQRLIDKMLAMFPLEQLFGELTAGLSEAERAVGEELARCQALTGLCLVFRADAQGQFLADLHAQLQRVTQRCPSPTAWNLLGLIAAYAGRHNEARASYGKALEIDPGCEHARRNLGTLEG